MSQLGKLHFTVTDDLGNVIENADVEIRRQGATIQSGGPLVFTVDSPGGIVIGDVVGLNEAASGETVSGVTATTVTVGGAGIAGSTNNDRLSIVATLATLYLDSERNQSTSNPLSTDANGEATAWVEGGFYDVRISGGGLTPRLRRDERAVGESNISNAFPTGSATVWDFNTSRAMSSGDKILSHYGAGWSGHCRRGCHCHRGRYNGHDR